MGRVFLNIDAGELDDEPEELFAIAEVVNVACGGHAGDAASMDRAIARAAKGGAQVGAHPSYPDRANFGRAMVAATPDEACAFVREQCKALLRAAGLGSVARLCFVKPHGALYHAANADAALAAAIVQGSKDALGSALTWIGPPRGALASAVREAGLGYAGEAFADRGVRVDGTLVPRGEPGALITDPFTAAGRARELARLPDVDTVCVHGDTPGALAIARAVRSALA
jgi:UPF0271 protein